ncbi:hypothetical protein SSYM_0621, partial [Serratia symbiotica str. Tucson]
MVYLPVLICS